MTIKIDGFSELLNILKDLFSGVKSAIQIPENIRKDLRASIADTAELIDETLTILKQHLSTVVSELKFGDKQKARQMIYELAIFPEWENKYRQFQLCEKLREAAFNLERKGLYQFVHNASLNQKQVIQQKMEDYIGGEANAAKSIGIMLQDLSQLEAKVDTDFDAVVKHLETARTEVGNCRQSFIDLEKEIRI